MADVNEEIVKAYYEAQGYIVKTNHYYVKRKFTDGKKIGQGPADIDLIIIHPQTNDKAIISVKGWHNDVVRKSNIKNWKEKSYMKLKIDEQTVEAGKEFFGDNNFRKLLVLSCIDKKDYQELRDDLKDFYKYDEVLHFPTLLHDLVEGNKNKNILKVNDYKHYRDSEFLQTLRLFVKHYIKSKNLSKK